MSHPQESGVQSLPGVQWFPDHAHRGDSGVPQMTFIWVIFSLLRNHNNKAVQWVDCDNTLTGWGSPYIIWRLWVQVKVFSLIIWFYNKMCFCPVYTQIWAYDKMCPCLGVSSTQFVFNSSLLLSVYIILSWQHLIVPWLRAPLNVRRAQCTCLVHAPSWPSGLVRIKKRVVIWYIWLTKHLKL